LKFPSSLGVTGVISTGLVNDRIVHGCWLGRVKIRGAEEVFDKSTEVEELMLWFQEQQAA